MKYPNDFIDKFLCGDNLEILKQMPNDIIPICNTDPPYNLGKNYGDFDDSRDPWIYWNWIKDRFKEIYRVMSEPGFLYVSHSDKGIFQLKPMLEEIGFNFVQLLYWLAKNGYGQRNKTRWSYRVEPILFMTKGTDYELISGNGLEWYTSYFEVPRPQSNFKEGRWHPTEKPIKLYRLILCRTPGDIVIDPFIGSGSTAIACKQLGKHFIGIDCNKEYIEISKKRYLRKPVRIDKFVSVN